MFVSSKNTVIAGVSLGGLMIVGYFLGGYIHPIIYQLVMFLGLILAPLAFMLYQRKYVGGYLNYGKTFQAGFLPILIAVFSLSFSTGMYFQLNEAAFTFEKLKTQANLTSSGMPKEKIEATVNAMRPYKSALLYFFTFWLVGTLSCLLFSIFVYKSPKVVTPSEFR